MKIKNKLNKEKANVTIKKRNKVLFLIKNLINDKLKNLYIKTFLIKEIKEITILLKLLNIKTFFRFHTSLFKKVSLFTSLIKI